MAKKSATKKISNVVGVESMFGEYVFDTKKMKKYLSAKAYESICKTIHDGGKLNPAIADEVAEAMKDWAVSLGATHYTHWFQPLTGLTAEKHDSFMKPDLKGNVVVSFSGADLIQGEPDASSFPSGGLRPTFEARGYTGWDPTSPVFIKVSPQGSTLCIPTFFIGYHGEALDKKTPLLRSINALSKQVCRLGELFGIKTKGKRAFPTLGPEQEYFLIDREFYYQRIDLIQTGRTLFGREPAKHQQMADHYFGAIKNRVIAFMEDLDREMWKLGAPIRTRHNEVAPGQFEVAPVYEHMNLAIDHNMLLMEVMQKVAEKHDLACLLHEKPFYGVNGSGKHNNWAITGPDGKNWFSPGSDPHDNAKFITMLCAVMMATDKHAELIRCGIASAANDHRLGSHEAPPAIISIFLGDQLLDIIEQVEKGGATTSKKGGVLELGVDSLPTLPRDATDRNRTSPFAFTGNKFEVRAAGSGQSLAGLNVVLNTIMADALDEICTELEGAVKKGKDFKESLQKILCAIIKKHKRVLFNGDNYSEDWKKEAAKRGLPNLKTTPEALPYLKKTESIALFEKHGVLTKKELLSRCEVYTEAYATVITYEGSLAAHMAKTLIVPVAFAYLEDLAETIKSVESLSAGKALKAAESRKLLAAVSEQTEKTLAEVGRLEAALKAHTVSKVKESMDKLRVSVDELEGLLPSEEWPLPTYAEMLFML